MTRAPRFAPTGATVFERPSQIPLKLSVGVSRKVGALGASWGVEVELESALLRDDPEEFDRRARQAHAACARAVDAELARLAAPPAPAPRDGGEQPPPPAPGPAAPAGDAAAAPRPGRPRPGPWRRPRRAAGLRRPRRRHGLGRRRQPADL